MNVKKNIGLLVGILVLCNTIIFNIQDNIVNAEEIIIEHDRKNINWQDFKNYFNNNIDYLLEYRVDNGEWIEGNQFLNINKTWMYNGGWKINLEFNNPDNIHKIDARFTIAITSELRNYFNKTSYGEYLLNYTNNDINYNMIFNWCDLLNISGLIFNHGIKNNMFWFRFRKDNVPFGLHIFDPSLTVEDEAYLEDSWITESNPSRNYGGDARLVIQEFSIASDFHALLDFDISGIPVNKCISSATLRMNYYKNSGYDPTGKDVNVYRLTRAFDEGTGNYSSTVDVIWNYADYPSVAWTTGGGDYATPEIDSVTIGSYGWYEWNVTDCVIDWYDGTYNNYGFLVRFPDYDDGTYRCFFYSSEGNDLYDPQLVIYYDDCDCDCEITSGNVSITNKTKDVDFCSIKNWTVDLNVSCQEEIYHVSIEIPEVSYDYNVTDQVNGTWYYLFDDLECETNYTIYLNFTCDDENWTHEYYWFVTGECRNLCDFYNLSQLDIWFNSSIDYWEGSGNMDINVGASLLLTIVWIILALAIFTLKERFEVYLLCSIAITYLSGYMFYNITGFNVAEFIVISMIISLIGLLRMFRQVIYRQI